MLGMNNILGLTVQCPICYAEPEMRCLRDMSHTTTISDLCGLQFMRSNESHKARRQLEEPRKDVRHQRTINQVNQEKQQ